MSAPSNAGFLLEWLVAAVYESTFHRVGQALQKKCLLGNKHHTCACKCRLPLETGQLHRPLWQVTNSLLVATRNCPRPSGLLYVTSSFFHIYYVPLLCHTGCAVMSQPDYIFCNGLLIVCNGWELARNIVQLKLFFSVIVTYVMICRHNPKLLVRF